MLTQNTGKKKLTPREIRADMVDTLGDDAPGLSTMQKWAAERKKGRKSHEDDPRSGRPATTTTPKVIDRVHQTVMGDRRLTISHMAKEVSISHERVENILQKNLAHAKFLLDLRHGF